MKSQSSSDQIGKLVLHLCGANMCKKDRFKMRKNTTPTSKLEYNGVSESPLRILAKAMANRIDVDEVKKNGELWPGGDIRIQDNHWLRAAFVDANIAKVPRENTFRASVEKLVKKKKLRS